MPPLLPKSTSLPQEIISTLSKKVKAKKVAVPKIKSSTGGKSMLKSLIKNAKAQTKGLSKTAGVKSHSVKKLPMAKMPSSTSSKISTSLKRGLSKLG